VRRRLLTVTLFSSLGGFAMQLSGAAYPANLAALDGSRPPSFASIAKKTMPVVVNISTLTQTVAALRLQ